MIKTPSVKRLYFRIRTVHVFGPIIHPRFRSPPTPRDIRPFLFLRLRYLPPMLEIPGILLSRLIIFYMLEIPSPLQHDRSEPLFCKLFSGPSSTDTRPDNARIVSIFSNGIGIYML